VGVTISSARLQLELARRGWCGCNLARAAGISAPTSVRSNGWAPGCASDDQADSAGARSPRHRSKELTNCLRG
jgi:hypothetical protein